MKSKNQFLDTVSNFLNLSAQGAVTLTVRTLASNNNQQKFKTSLSSDALYTLMSVALTHLSNTENSTFLSGEMRRKI